MTDLGYKHSGGGGGYVIFVGRRSGPSKDREEKTCRFTHVGSLGHYLSDVISKEDLHKELLHAFHTLNII